MAGRRRVSSYNPLSGELVGSKTNDIWVCTARDEVNYYARDEDMMQKLQWCCGPGEKVKATKEGDWLSVLEPGPARLESGLYLPVMDPLDHMERLFRNERAMLWEVEKGRPRSYSDGSVVGGDRMSRQTSDLSSCESYMGAPTSSKNGSKSWVCTAESGALHRSEPAHDAVPGRRCQVNEQVVAIAEDGWLRVLSGGTETGTFLPMTDPNTNALIFRAVGGSARKFGTASSFRWVDSVGLSHRMSQTASEEAIKQSEVWICVSPTSVHHCSDPECQSTSSQMCRPGDKVNGVKRGSAIQVMEVTETTDMAQMLGRRSLKSGTQLDIKVTGTYLPFSDPKTGDRFFKNEKLVLWEQAEKGEIVVKDEGSGCSVM